ncbi:glycosyl transferase family 1 [Thermococcus guaymasensis DSM 11113]|uniref:Glycosyl transferase family 1 n=1 Tax=Thermococcus guaymasensis DSM 11113 TaxID=1432656 RepID=A0A0X1KJL9_9EURY|nr:glycosyltransferase family 4 protein [Thermococcus guaymasensis]AJC71437.1 glycosyl transferase family 1 [Thermococcus guaymasensis DSM 11113]
MSEFENKNLLILTNSYPDEDNRHYGGIFVKEQVRYLARHFNEIYVISPQPYGSNRNLRDYEYDNVRVYYPRFFHLPVEFFRKRLGDNFFKAAMRVIEREKLEFDLIHAHFTWPGGYAGVKLAKEFEVPVVITIHENRDWFLREYNSGNEKIYWTWRNADALLRVNKKDVPLLREFNLNVYSIPNGFNPGRLKIIEKKAARTELGLKDDAKIIFSLGALIERKGFHYLIDAMHLVTKKRKDVICFIGGNGPLKKRLQQQINRLGLQNHVKLLGFVPDDQLALWMNAADLFVLPSLSEGNPTVMFEALGVGLPFIGTTVGGVPEIIISDDYGLLCPPKDPECLAEKILIALDKEWDREKIREYAGQFTWENIVKEIIKIATKIML